MHAGGLHLDVGPGAGNAFEHVAAALQLGNHLFNRATGHELHQCKVDDHDAQKRGDHQQKTS